jgi:hypothetical protein
MPQHDFNIPSAATIEEKFDLIFFSMADISKKQGISVKLEEKVTIL